MVMDSVSQWIMNTNFFYIIQVLQVLQCFKSHSLASGFEAFLLYKRSRVL